MGEKKKEGGAFRALYRKYRSKSLDEIIGQEHITKTLANAVKHGKVSHAYLFTGPRGVGKTSIARILAHEINGLPYEDEQSHLDIIEIDAASNRRIDDIRDLRDKVHIAPLLAKYKVYIIDEVHMLTSESFNALLKTLEEPPNHVVFILATTEVHKLPATIISRTQRHSFRSIPPEKVTHHLQTIAKQEGIKLDEEAAYLLAEHGEGSFRDSISLLDQLGSGDEPVTTDLVELMLGLAPKTLLQDLLDAALTGDSRQIILVLEKLVESGLTPAAIASQLLKLLRHEVKSGQSPTKESVLLMQQLLDIPSAQYPQLKLEATLLGITPKSSYQVPEEKQQPTVKDVPKVEKQPEAATVQAESKPNVEPTVKTEKSASVPKKTTSKSTGTLSIEEDWPAILEQTKQKNNPLYTVLRMATPELQDGQLQLIFAFPFHQKKVDEPKYKSLIAEIITNQTGATVQIQTIVDKKRVRSDATLSTEPKDNAHASLISSVQDIMGGGEVVNL